jgi:hypothetical protein
MHGGFVGFATDERGARGFSSVPFVAGDLNQILKHPIPNRPAVVGAAAACTVGCVVEVDCG